MGVNKACVFECIQNSFICKGVYPLIEYSYLSIDIYSSHWNQYGICKKRSCVDPHIMELGVWGYEGGSRTHERYKRETLSISWQSLRAELKTKDQAQGRNCLMNHLIKRKENGVSLGIRAACMSDLKLPGVHESEPYDRSYPRTPFPPQAAALTRRNLLGRRVLGLCRQTHLQRLTNFYFCKVMHATVLKCQIILKGLYI